MASLTEQDFRLAADCTIEQAQRALLPLADQEGFEEPAPATFVVSLNAPVRQVWVSARSRSFKLSWADQTSVCTFAGETLDALIERLAREHLAGPTG